jgi:hypothetical protein
VLACLALIGVACYLPPAAEVLKLTPPDLRGWAIVLAASLSAMVLGKAVALGLGRLLAPPHREGQAPTRS